MAAAKANITAWLSEAERGLDAIVITASGCGTTIKDYGFMLREDPEWAERAAEGLRARQGRDGGARRRSTSAPRSAAPMR